jgi:hypothetical protein
MYGTRLQTTLEYTLYFNTNDTAISYFVGGVCADAFGRMSCILYGITHCKAEAALSADVKLQRLTSDTLSPDPPPLQYTSVNGINMWRHLFDILNVGCGAVGGYLDTQGGWWCGWEAHHPRAASFSACSCACAPPGETLADHC